jgi:hypothetical protein
LEQGHHGDRRDRITEASDVFTANPVTRVMREVGQVHQENPEECETSQHVRQEIAVDWVVDFHNSTFLWRMAKTNQGETSTCPHKNHTTALA